MMARNEGGGYMRDPFSEALDAIGEDGVDELLEGISRDAEAGVRYCARCCRPRSRCECTNSTAPPRPPSDDVSNASVFWVKRGKAFEDALDARFAREQKTDEPDIDPDPDRRLFSRDLLG